MAAKPLPDAAYLRERLAYDPDTGVFLWKERSFAAYRGLRGWNVTDQFAGREAGRIDHYGYRVIKIDGRLYKAHRLAWKMQTGSDPLLEIDHRNGNRGDNRWANLRAATYAEQMHNSSGWSGRSLPKGVQKYGNRYYARGTVAGRYHHLGSFGTVEEAADAYRAFAEKMHGAFFRGG